MVQASARKHVVIYVHGMCSESQGTGGWGCVLKFGEHRKELNGFMQETTRRRMVLFAAISGLGALKESCLVTLYSDSGDLADAFDNHRIESWRAANWQDAKGHDIPDKDLWFILMAQSRRHQVRCLQVRNLQADAECSRCAELAENAVQEWRLINSPHDQDGKLIVNSEHKG